MIHPVLGGAGSLFAARHQPVAALTATAAGVVAVDEVSKAAALYFAGPLGLGIVHNQGLAWGLGGGAEVGAVSAVAALVVFALSVAVCGALTVHDRAAPLALGLIGGAGFANTTDALTPPAGVIDWITVGTRDGAVVGNLADLAVLIGLGLIARTGCRLALAIRAQRGTRR